MIESLRGVRRRLLSGRSVADLTDTEVNQFFDQLTRAEAQQRDPDPSKDASPAACVTPVSGRD